MEFLNDLLNTIDATVAAYVQNSVQGLAPHVQDFYRILCTLFIAFTGYRMLFKLEGDKTEITIAAFKIVAIGVVAFKWSYFEPVIYDTATNLPSDAAIVILDENAATIATTATGRAGRDRATGTATATADNLDEALMVFYSTGTYGARKVVQEADGIKGKIGAFGVSALLLVGVLALTVFALALIVLSKLALAILMSVGPFFILTLMFQKTRGFFEGWLKAVVNYALVPLFVYALLALFLLIAAGPINAMMVATNGYSGTGPEPPKIETVAAGFTILAFMGVILMLQINGMASSVAGGLSLQTMNMMSVASNTVRGAVGAPKQAGQAGLSAAKAGAAGAVAGAVGARFVGRQAQRGGEAVRRNVDRFRDRRVAQQQRRQGGGGMPKPDLPRQPHRLAAPQRLLPPPSAS